MSAGRMRAGRRRVSGRREVGACLVLHADLGGVPVCAPQLKIATGTGTAAATPAPSLTLATSAW